MLNLNISKFHHPSGYRKTFNRKCFCCFMVCTCDRRIRRTAHQLIEFDGRHSKSLNLMVCPPNRGIPRSVLQISSCSSSITISSTSINVRSKCTSRNSTLRHAGIFIHREPSSPRQTVPSRRDALRAPGEHMEIHHMIMHTSCTNMQSCNR